MESDGESGREREREEERGVRSVKSERVVDKERE